MFTQILKRQCPGTLLHTRTIYISPLYLSLWDQEELNQLCLKEELWEAERDEEIRITCKEENEGPPVTQKSSIKEDSGEDWNGIRLDTVTKGFLAIEFKRT
jgi:hypothetical protein